MNNYQKGAAIVYYATSRQNIDKISSCIRHYSNGDDPAIVIMVPDYLEAVDEGEISGDLIEHTLGLSDGEIMHNVNTQIIIIHT